LTEFTKFTELAEWEEKKDYPSRIIDSPPASFFIIIGFQDHLSAGIALLSWPSMPQC